MRAAACLVPCHGYIDDAATAAAAAVTRVVSSGHINVQVNILTKVRMSWCQQWSMVVIDQPQQPQCFGLQLAYINAIRCAQRTALKEAPTFYERFAPLSSSAVRMP
jgi:hypothetical protein